MLKRSDSRHVQDPCAIHHQDFCPPAKSVPKTAISVSSNLSTAPPSERPGRACGVKVAHRLGRLGRLSGAWGALVGAVYSEDMALTHSGSLLLRSHASMLALWRVWSLAVGGKFLKTKRSIKDVSRDSRLTRFTTVLSDRALSFTSPCTFMLLADWPNHHASLLQLQAA